MPILNNVEDIIKELSTKVSSIMKMEKFDGITIEFTLSQKNKFETVKEQLQTLCGELNLLPINIQQNKENDKLFVVEFPDLNVLYNDEQLYKFYTDSFKWLFDNAISKSSMVEIKVTKQLLLMAKENYVKQAIQIFCRSNINPYKDNINNYTNNVEYRKKIDNMFYQYVDYYCTENNII